MLRGGEGEKNVTHLVLEDMPATVQATRPRCCGADRRRSSSRPATINECPTRTRTPVKMAKTSRALLLSALQLLRVYDSLRLEGVCLPKLTCIVQALPQVVLLRTEELLNGALLPRRGVDQQRHLLSTLHSNIRLYQKRPGSSLHFPTSSRHSWLPFIA